MDSGQYRGYQCHLSSRLHVLKYQWQGREVWSVSQCLADNKPLNLDCLFNHKEILYIGERLRWGGKKDTGEIKNRTEGEGPNACKEIVCENMHTHTYILCLSHTHSFSCSHTCTLAHTDTHLQGTDSEEKFLFSISEWSIWLKFWNKLDTKMPEKTF